MNPTNSLPSFYVFPKAPFLEPLDASAVKIAEALKCSSALKSKKAVLIIVDQAYQHKQHDLEKAVKEVIYVSPARGNRSGAYIFVLIIGLT